MPWRHSSKPNGVYKRTSPCMKATLSRHRKPFTLSFWHKRTGVSNMMWTSTSLEGGREGAVQVCDVRGPGGLTLGSLSHLTLPPHCLSYSLHYCGLLETTSLKLGNQLSLRWRSHHSGIVRVFVWKVSFNYSYNYSFLCYISHSLEENL